MSSKRIFAMPVQIAKYIRTAFNLFAEANKGIKQDGGEHQQSEIAIEAESFIDFNEIARRYSFSEHAERANDYFSKLDMTSPIVRKPYNSPMEGAELSSGVSALLSNLFLFPGAKVLDFGAGTCWLSRILALLGCEVTAVDVSENALRVGKELMDRDSLSDRLNVSFSTLTGMSLPFADATFDRVVCFDALHHCLDQRSVIREFYRVLKDGGIAAFHEPGPKHSSSGQSQYEMRNYQVIEADIVVEDLFSEAASVGFSKAELAVYVTRPVMLDLASFNNFMTHPVKSAGASALLRGAKAENENRRVFFLHKGNVLDHVDSRSAFGLLAGLDMFFSWSPEGILAIGSVENEGIASWLPANHGVGSVNIGVHLHDEFGAMIDNDFMRHRFLTSTCSRGERRDVEFTIPFPANVSKFIIVVDLVAEGVTWFEIGGSRVVRAVVDVGERTVRIA